MKKYLELEMDVIALLQTDIITNSPVGEGDKTDDPYDSGNNWWENSK